jgi:hypothetical protein
MSTALFSARGGSGTGTAEACAGGTGLEAVSPVVAGSEEALAAGLDTAGAGEADEAAAGGTGAGAGVCAAV